MTAKRKAPKKSGEALTREARAEIAQNLANIEAAEKAAASGHSPTSAEPDVVPVAAAGAKGRKEKRAPAAKPTTANNAPKANVAKKGGPRKTKATTEPKAKRLSALDAAAQVLASSKEPMNTKAMIAEMEKKGLWTSPGGKTPAATLYAAITREISTKKREARFVKSERGLFTFNQKAGR